MKREAKGDPSDAEMEDSAMDSLSELWHREDDPDIEVDLLIFQQRDRYDASVHETGGDKPVCEEPKTPSHTMKAVGFTLTTRVASCSIIHVSRRRQSRKFRSFVNLVSGRWLTDSVTRSCLVHAGLTSTKETNTNRSASPPLEALRSSMICATIDEHPH